MRRRPRPIAPIGKCGRRRSRPRRSAIVSSGRDAERVRKLRHRLRRRRRRARPMPRSRVALADRLVQRKSGTSKSLASGNGLASARPSGAVRLPRGLEHHVEADLFEHLVLLGLLEHPKARRDIGLERELLQQPRAEGVDGLHLEAARRLQRRARTAAAPAPAASASMSRVAGRADGLVELGVVERRSIGRASSKMRFAMLAAAALVKVRHRIFAGSVPSSSSRITRCASTWVLPEPALADTHADAAGSDAACWSAMTASGMARGSFAVALGFVGIAGQRPFLDARQMS